MNPLVEIRELKFRWQQTLPNILDIQTFQVQPGEKILLKGPSGSGKSTFLNLLGGVLKPNSGHVKIDGIDLASISAASRDQLRADRMGYIFQQFNLLPYLSVEENILLPCLFSTRRKSKVGSVESLLNRLGLKYEKIRNKPVTELSVGQCQRVAAARALMGEPDLLVADEPTSSLDTENREEFLRLLFEECKKTKAAIIFVSHDPQLATFFDRSLDWLSLNRAVLTESV